MLEPIMTRAASSTISSGTFKVIDTQTTKMPETDAAEAQVASLYYQSTIGPAKNSDYSSENLNVKKITETEKIQAPQKSWFSKAKDWLKGLFGIAKDVPANQPLEKEIDAASSDMLNANDPLNLYPSLDVPDIADQNNMAKTIAELNQKLVHRLKDIVEFEEEMRKTEELGIDKLLFRQLIYSTLYQKKLKEEGSLVIYSEVSTLQSRIKTLQDEYYNLQMEVIKRKKANKVLHWTGIGLTAGIVGSIAALFATGGTSAVLTGSLSLMSLTKGGTTLSGGILKYKNDLNTGKMVVVGQDSKSTNKKIADEISELQNNNEDISNLIKTIRHHLDNQSQAERACIKRN